MATPSSPPRPPPLLLPPPESTQPQIPSPQKKTQPIPWTHQETFNLIQSYQEKWYSLKKGQLKASQWEEVAITVAARCGFDEPSKSATQCRHKIEKLRKRYRAERLKPYPNSWQYFDLMDHMERGPLPIAAHPVAMVKCSNSGGDQRYYDTDNSDEVDVSYMDLRRNNTKCRSINHMMGVNVNVGGGGDNRNVMNRMVKDRNFMRNSINNNIPSAIPQVGSVRFGEGRMFADFTPTFVGRNSMNEKRKGYFGNVGVNDEDDDDDVEEEVDEEENEDEEDGEGSVGGSELAAEIRRFAERFMRMEHKKIEMMKETERYRMEMEKRRMDMILETQRSLIDRINSVVGSHKKVKVAHEF
ncbi:trihelix transcription factor ASIL2 [Lycium ferocissimum]|uniref:trihelix transcription factor ASIL2 n=1 Tax=Lycium ferocissimum TaxID=112874 RepID=UPI00281531E0|nr:trihelix transcription factor ASIL2 [Lycium ferocissimum]